MSVNSPGLYLLMPIVFAVAAACIPTAQGAVVPAHACTVPLTKSLDLLDARLVMRVPAPARIEQRQASLMAAPQSLQEETHVLIESDGSVLSFTARELFATAPSDLEQAVRKELQSDPVTIRSRTLPSGLRLVEFFPSAPQASANLIWGAYIANGDGTLERIAFYGDGPQAQLPADCLRNVTAMANSLAPGKRALSIKGGTVEIAGRVTVNLPPLYTTSVQNGADFTVYKVKKLAPLGSSPGMVGLYLGNYPSFSGQGQSGGKVTLLGKATEWHDSNSQDRFLSEALIILDPTRHDYAHVFIYGSSTSELLELKRVAQTMALKRAAVDR